MRRVKESCRFSHLSCGLILHAALLTEGNVLRRKCWGLKSMLEALFAVLTLQSTPFSF